jgi:hypothetical protein
MGVTAKEIEIAMHHIAPDGVVLRGVLVVVLTHHELA